MTKLESLRHLLQTFPDLELAVLVGSQALGTATSHSDWDIAIPWEKQLNDLTQLKQKIADVIHKPIQITSIVGIQPTLTGKL